MDGKKRPEASRDAATGRFVKGNKSGGRKAKPDSINGISAMTVPELVEMAFDPAVRQETRATILRWLTEMDLGKPGQKVDVEARTEGVQIIQFEGELEEWAH